MTRSTSAVAEQGKRRGIILKTRVCICLTVLLVFAVVSASAQSTAVPPTNAFQILGISPATPAPSNPPTAPVGGIILYGSQTSPITNQPVRHLWIGDSNFGMCRIDPDIDAGMALIAANPAGPSPFNITVSSCPFKLNGLSVTGGPMAFDPSTNNVYLTDEQTNSEGIFRIGYLPTGDAGQGALDFNNVFAMAGNITGSRFSGGTTGCAFPNDSVETVLLNNVLQSVVLGVPNGLALGPDGNVWVAFKKSGAILRINNPATASAAGFGTCSDFIQLVAEGTSAGGGNGIAFIGHDLWGAAEAGPFVIRSADTTCQALGTAIPQVPTCPDTTPAVAAFAALTPTTVYGDQTYPYLNGNNLYFGDATDDMWVGNISGGGTVVVDPFEPAGVFQFNGLPPNVNAIVADPTDPANVVAYSGDDPSANAILAAGRWWRVAQNPPTRAAKPNVVTVVRATAAGNTITVSWSPAQTGVPVTSYTVRASTGTLADHTVTPALGGTFPPNFLVIPGVANGTYAFKVIANNAQGNNGLSAASNTVTIPTVVPPGIPTNVAATAGDATAFVNFVAPPSSAAQAITGYKVTSIPAGGVSAVVPATATSATVTNLINGTSYTFTVHAINAGGNSMESTPSNAVTPVHQVVPLTLALTGPISVPAVPVMSTFTATLTNNTATAATGVTLNYALTQAIPDGAAVLIGQPGQGTCVNTSSTGVACTIGTVAEGASVSVNFIVQIVAQTVTSTVTFSGTATPTGGTAAVQTGTSTITTLTPSAPPQGGVGPTLTVTVTGSSAKPTLNTGATTTHTFVATNTGSVTADQLSFTISEPTQLGITSVTAVSSAPATDPVACAAPTAGTLNNQPVNNIVCTIASLGGNLKNGNKPTTAQTITITVGIAAQTAKLQTPQTLNVSSIVVFNGIDAVSPSANFVQTVK
ncbi:MAG TPA: fibronectin type III domain-containing protein [Candidatus Angelobacter sp.]|jgi:hypothetical protein